MVNLVKHDLEFILPQILIAEQHASGTPLMELVDSPLLPAGLRKVDGSLNNIMPGREQWAHQENLSPVWLSRISAPVKGQSPLGQDRPVKRPFPIMITPRMARITI
jgi:hypothetical protein